MSVSKKLKELINDYRAWAEVTQTLESAKWAESRAFAELRDKLGQHNELTNRDVISDLLKERIADEVLK